MTKTWKKSQKNIRCLWRWVTLVVFCPQFRPATKRLYGPNPFRCKQLCLLNNECLVIYKCPSCYEHKMQQKIQIAQGGSQHGGREVVWTHVKSNCGEEEVYRTQGASNAFPASCIESKNTHSHISHCSWSVCGISGTKGSRYVPPPTCNQIRLLLKDPGGPLAFCQTLKKKWTT